MQPQTFDYEAGNRRLIRALYIIAALWAATIPAVALTYPGAPWYHLVWVAFLLANMIGWAGVCVAGLVAELSHSVRAVRVSIKRAKRERASASPVAPGQLALD